MNQSLATSHSPVDSGLISRTAGANRTYTVEALLLLAGVVYAASVLFLFSLETLTAIPSDDAFYYFRIAKNIAEGNGSTFGGIAATNGYHPLWMTLLVPVFWISNVSLETPVRIVLAANGVLCAITLVMLYRLVERHVAIGCGLVALAVFLLPNALIAMLNGLETGVLLFVVIAVLHLCYTKRLHELSAGPGKSFVFGVLLGLCALCRLDTVFLVISAGAITVCTGVCERGFLKRGVLRIVAMGIGFTLTLAPYLAWNTVNFGSLMPISGAMKSSFPHVRESSGLWGDMKLATAMLAVLLLLMAIIAVGDRRRGGFVKVTLRSPVFMLVVACVFHYTHAYLFLVWGIYWWHFTLYALAIALALSEIVGRISGTRPRLGRIAMGAIVAGCILLAVPLHARQLSLKGQQHAAWLRAAQWVEQTTPADSVFAIKDAGLFGYFSQRRTINLDGKANGLEYQAHLADDRVHDYLLRYRTNYVADITARYRNGEYWIKIPRVGAPAAVLEMSEADEIYRSLPIPTSTARLGSPQDAYFAIWRYPSRTALANP